MELETHGHVQFGNQLGFVGYDISIVGYGMLVWYDVSMLCYGMLLYVSMV